MGALAQVVFGDFITLAIVLSARRLFVIRLRRRYVDGPVKRKRNRSGGFHQTVLAEGLEPYPGADRTWEITCGNTACADRKAVYTTYAQAQNFALAHEEDPEYNLLPVPARTGRKGGKRHG